MKILTVLAAWLLVLGSCVADEVPWIDLTNTNRVCAASGSAVFQSSVFDNDWFACLISNSLRFFSTKVPTGMTFIFK